jgi:hypothetical protein
VRVLDPKLTTIGAAEHHPHQRHDDAADKVEVDVGDDDRGEDAQTTTRLLPAGCFLIGNHADELTPWMPLLATRVRASGYLSIPCCAWTLDARFDRAQDLPFCAVGPEALNLGGTSGTGEGTGSPYALYRIWLASLSVYCGW